MPVGTGSWIGGPGAAASVPEASRSPGRASRGFPPASWPTVGQLDYTQKLITALLLVLALPWLVGKLLTNPAMVLAGVGRRHLKP
jgi:hypothetical protein